MSPFGFLTHCRHRTILFLFTALFSPCTGSAAGTLTDTQMLVSFCVGVDRFEQERLAGVPDSDLDQETKKLIQNYDFAETKMQRYLAITGIDLASASDSRTAAALGAIKYGHQLATDELAFEFKCQLSQPHGHSKRRNDEMMECFEEFPGWSDYAKCDLPGPAGIPF